MRFISYDQITKWSMTVRESNSLEAIYSKFNSNHPPGYTGHSLSISDVVELYDGEGSEFQVPIKESMTRNWSDGYSRA
ncbi:YodL domain-containing protein [Desulfosporosinus nitroreducens]|uniref:YodL domain-containing protein n=1 Tax=Desulfosporosinus nitroreducens TaxID=2018668 RepID=A0ABT8QW53_9FIRM|nr:YodL domain-containing protein [Desulfosporosinus nitroreducens]MDO0825560.1 YodL domain-containing protein [Desulfosporosinus nitroreducens]